MKKYQIIYADPPWQFKNYAPLKSLKQDRAHGRPTYDTMNLTDICGLPVKDIADKDCVLFMWATMPMLEHSFNVINEWGFTYKTVAFTWVKSNPSGTGFYSGLGHWTCANSELCLLATHKTFPKKRKMVKQIIYAPIGIHSRKPDEVRDKIVQLMGDLPRIELFARQKVSGWDCWGNEVESDIEL